MQIQKYCNDLQLCMIVTVLSKNWHHSIYVAEWSWRSIGKRWKQLL